jgi:hypothetical protein
LHLQKQVGLKRGIHRQPRLIPGLLTEWCRLSGQDPDYWPALKGPGISQRAAAARTQTVWRWLVQSFWCLGYLLPSAPNDRRFRAGSKKASPGGEATSFKLQALDNGPGYDRINL